MEAAQDIAARPPFSPSAARRARRGLHMTLDQVAYGLAAFRVAAGPGRVAAWEAGTDRPTEAELLALAETLWCSPGELMGTAGALREHRIGRRLTVAELCARIGLPPSRYTAMERANAWRGDSRSTAALARELGFSHRDLVAVAGSAAELEQLLAETVRGRPKAQLSVVARLTGLRRSRVSAALTGLHREFAYREHLALSWTSGVPGTRPHAAEPPPPATPAALADRFWALLGHPAADPGAAGVWSR
ncbi:helix-turn-helix domain-containing protein [Uniformispora flossi]|uniref:helix-turn-helix domain-containing protein n=1 Tax=Uniformispora flossi TaxID=3390723 RepID=UPI003C2C624D